MTTLAGGQQTPGFVDAPQNPRRARFHSPRALVGTPDGRALLVIDTENHRVRRVCARSGATTTLAAGFNLPSGAAFDGERLLVADMEHNCVRAVRVTDGAVTTFAGAAAGAAAAEEDDDDAAGDRARAGGGAAAFSWPWGVAVAPDGAVYVSECIGQRIVRLAPRGGGASVLAGGGGAAAGGERGESGAGGEGGEGGADGADGDDGAGGGAGAGGYADGVGARAAFRNPGGIALAPGARALVVADATNNRVRRVELATGEVTTVAGSEYAPRHSLTTREREAGLRDGPAEEARFWFPRDVAVAADGTIYVADSYNQSWSRGLVHSAWARMHPNGTTVREWPSCEAFRNQEGIEAHALRCLPTWPI